MCTCVAVFIHQCATASFAQDSDRMFATQLKNILCLCQEAKVLMWKWMRPYDIVIFYDCANWWWIMKFHVRFMRGYSVAPCRCRSVFPQSINEPCNECSCSFFFSQRKLLVRACGNVFQDYSPIWHMLCVWWLAEEQHDGSVISIHSNFHFPLRQEILFNIFFSMVSNWKSPFQVETNEWTYFPVISTPFNRRYLGKCHQPRQKNTRITWNCNEMCSLRLS